VRQLVIKVLNNISDVDRTTGDRNSFVFYLSVSKSKPGKNLQKGRIPFQNPRLPTTFTHCLPSFHWYRQCGYV